MHTPKTLQMGSTQTKTWNKAERYIVGKQLSSVEKVICLFFTVTGS